MEPPKPEFFYYISIYICIDIRLYYIYIYGGCVRIKASFGSLTKGLVAKENRLRSKFVKFISLDEAREKEREGFQDKLVFFYWGPLGWWDPNLILVSNWIEMRMKCGSRFGRRPPGLKFCLLLLLFFPYCLSVYLTVLDLPSLEAGPQSQEVTFEPPF